MNTDVTISRADWKRDAERLRQVRNEVFVIEQNVPVDIEFDGRDETATHFMACDPNGQVIGTARLLPDGQVGRMAVLQRHRRRGVGRMLLDAAVEAAREAGRWRVFLHAQTHAVRFYTEAGFERDGEPFMEAGMPHLPMAREFPIEFRPPDKVIRLTIRQEAPPENEPRLADVESGFQRLDGDRELRDIILDMVRRARRLVRIYSQELDAKLFDTRDLAKALSTLARRHHSTRTQVMIHDSMKIVRDGHGLVDLRHRLPSSIEIRKAHADQYQTHFTYVLVDNEAYLMMPRHFEYAGYCNYGDAARVRRHNVHFDEQWNRAMPDPNLQVLSL